MCSGSPQEMQPMRRIRSMIRFQGDGSCPRFSKPARQGGVVTEQTDDILFAVSDGIGRITFNRPQARNAFTFQMYERLAEICLEANENPALKVLILTGAGDKAFASGTDINQFRAFKT